MVACEGLVKIYRASGVEVFALQGLDLQVSVGEWVAVAGNSGSGKSTLLNILGGLDAPSAGTVRVGEWDLSRLTRGQRDTYRRKEVAFLWQNAGLNLFPYLSVRDNILLSMSLSRVPSPAVAEELVELVGLGHRQHHRPAQLSGGEQQRAALAVALAASHRLLLADEPTGALDVRARQQVLAALAEVNRTLGTTILMVTHDREAAGYAARTVQIRDGKLATEAVRGEREVLVLDSAGRLPMPRPLLEAAGIGRRAEVELLGDQIVVRAPARPR